MVKSYSESVSAIGVATADNTTGGTAFVTLSASLLPFGLYMVDIYTQMSNITNASTSNNVRLQAGSRNIVTLIQHIVANNAAGFKVAPPETVYVRLDGLTALTLNFVANLAATETQVWNASIVATRVAD